MLWSVFAFKEKDGHSSWEVVTTKETQDLAQEAQRIYKQLNPGVPTKVGHADMEHVSWSVYRLIKGTGVWERMSTWDRRNSAMSALRVKRLSDPHHRYEIFRTGEAPDPVPDQADILAARIRREAAERIATALYEGRITNPNICRARRPGEEGIRSRCILMEDHIPPEHKTAYDVALEQLRRADEASAEIPVPGAGTSAGRVWYPPHSASGREAMEPFRPGDPAEDPQAMRDVRPAGDGLAPGDPNRARKGDGA